MNLRILLSNDDGVNAPGLKVLQNIAEHFSKDVWIAAPETEQSGTSHSLSMHLPVRMRQVSRRKYAISGTPTDSVLVACKALFSTRMKRPELLLSGVNRGSNLGEDVTYSGTVAAAMEGTLLGIPSIALSQSFTDHKPIHWATAERYAPQVIKKLLHLKWPEHVLMNVNFPDCPPDKVAGIIAAPQGVRSIGENVTMCRDPRGKPYYWIGGSNRHSVVVAESDIEAISRNYVTITPISINLTDYDTLKTLNNL